ncbi:hypothetical protein [Mesobacillus jeotgali]|uniref:hypothetical protein n=1 Tax=Mesobacillus jeotgali TaxID=129985 RepID=UPI000C83FA88|nr:hypothetical protein [Mesobacillus jeotgali]
MNLQLEKKHLIILLSLFVFLILLYFGAHFLYISPMKDSLALKESQLKTEQQLSKTLETRLSTASSSDFNSTMELQKTLPIDPMTEQLVLDLEKAEVVSNSYITAMEFSKDGQVIDREKSLNNEQGTTDSDNTAQGTETVSEVDSHPIQMPDGVSKTSVKVTVESESYFELEKFIATLEELQRIVMVESISFSGPEEIRSLSDDENKIIMNITINAFYLSGFDDLKGDNPKIETPAPANKRNPFPTFGDYSEDNLVEQEQSDVDETEGTDEN